MDKESNKPGRKTGAVSGKRRIKNITEDVHREQKKADMEKTIIIPPVRPVQESVKIQTQQEEMNTEHISVTGDSVQMKSNKGQSKKLKTKTPEKMDEYTEKSKTKKRQMSDKGLKSAEKKDRHKKKKSKLPALAGVVVIVAVVVLAAFIMSDYIKGANSSKKALEQYESGNYAEAALLYEEALSYEPKNAQYYLGLGMSKLGQKDYEASMDYFDRALDLSSKQKMLQAVYRGKGIVYLYQGRYSQAIEMLEKSLENTSGNGSAMEIDILYYLAEAQEKNDDYIDAVFSYSKIIDYQADASAYMLRGLAYQQVGDNSSAELDLYTAIQKNAKNYKLYLALYEVLTAQEKQSEAKKILNQAVSLGGKTGEDYANKGITYMYLEDYESAREAFDTALSKGYYAAYIGMAESAMRQEDYEVAVTWFETYFETGEGEAAAYNQYGMCLMELKRYEQAIDAFERGLDYNDRATDQALMFNVGVAYERMYQWDKALEKFEAYVEKYPDDIEGQKEYNFLKHRQ